MSIKWSEEDIQLLKFGCEDGLTVEEMAQAIDRTTKAVRNKLWRLGLLVAREWTDDQIKFLLDEYSTGKPVRSEVVEEYTGKTRAAVFLKASRLGLGDRNRQTVEFRKERINIYATKEERSAAQSIRQIKRIAEDGHPRGMLGKHHSQSAKDRISKAAIDYNANLSEDLRTEYTMKALKTKVANGTYGLPRKGCTWKAAWHEIGGKRKYYRSKWESNYAYYLEWIKIGGQIKEWSHEPKVFWFEGIKRGCVSYLPDFHVINNDGTEAYHEVKGWMDARSITKIKRMAKYYPDIQLIVIASKEYNSLLKLVGSTVPGWQK